MLLAYELETHKYMGRVWKDDYHMYMKFGSIHVDGVECYVLYE